MAGKNQLERTALFLVVAVSLLAAACGGGQGPAEQPTQIPVQETASPVPQATLVHTPTTVATAMPTAAPEATTQNLFQPFGPSGVAPGLDVGQTVEGNCFAESFDIYRSDAWRCTAGNEILDPCFTDPFQNQAFLICSDSPLSNTVTVLNLTEPLPALPTPSPDTVAMGKALPWVVELEEGQVCTFATGATGSIGGKRLNYACTGGGSVWGELDIGQPVWTAFFQASGSTALNEVKVTAVWY
jgi:hypothetical protein